jgi:hypothetical protein
MPSSDLLLLGCGPWGVAVVEALGREHPRAAALSRRLLLHAVEGETPVAGGPEHFSLMVPGASAFRTHVVTLAAREGTAALAPVLPRAWLADPAARMPRPEEIDDRYRMRHALLAAEGRIRRRLAEGLEGVRAALLVVAPDEPLGSAVLLPLGRWLRAEALERAKVADGTAPATVTALIGLDPVGGAAARDPLRAARLMAALSGLDRVRGGEADPFDDVLLVGRASVSRDDLASAAVEVVGWWSILGARRAAGLPPAIRPRTFRGRTCRYTLASGMTGMLDTGRLVHEECSRLGQAVAQQLCTYWPEKPALETREQVARMLAEIRQGLHLPGEAELTDAALGESTAAEVAPTSARHLDQLLEKVEERSARELERGRAFLAGGAIERMSGKVAPGYLRQQSAWCWRVLESGHASFDHVLGWFQGLSLALPLAPLEARQRELQRRVAQLGDAVARRRREGATGRVPLFHDHLRAVQALARIDFSLTLLRELLADIRETVAALLQAKATLASLQKLVTSTARPAPVSPWRALFRPPPDLLESFRREAGLQPGAWLHDLAAASAADLTRALARPPESVVEHLRAYVTRRLEAVATAHPLPQLPGVSEWLARAAADAPDTVAFEAAALPRGRAPLHDATLFSGAEYPLAVQVGLPSPPALVPSGEPTRVGLLRLAGPVPLLAVGELVAARDALAEAFHRGRLLPLPDAAQPTAPERFHDPLAADLGRRLLRQAAARSISPALPADLPDRLGKAGLTELLAFLTPLRALPRDLPALRQVATLADWACLTELSQLAGIDRAAQDLARHVEPDGSDAELVAACEAAAAVATPIKKGAEVASGADQVAHLMAADTALAEAEQLATSDLVGLERHLLTSILSTWRGWTAQRLRQLRGRSELAVRLKTRRLVMAGKATVLVEVQSRGDHPVLSGSVQILASPHFRVLGEDTRVLPHLAPGDARTIELAIKPQGPGPLQLELLLTWDDLEARGKQGRHAAEVTIVAEPPPFRRIERNPYIAGPPVRSEDMFFGRDDVFRYVNENLAGRYQDNILILHGQRRTGKSSILYQLERRDLLPEHVAVILDLQGLGGFDTAGLLYQLARHAARRLERRGGGLPSLPAPDRAAFQAACYDAFQEYLDRVEEALQPDGRRLLFMIDEFDVLEGRVERGNVEPEVFPFLRNLMQHRERIAFLLAGTQQLVEMRHDYWSILFSLASYRKVSFLAAEEARALVEQPLRGEVIFDDLVLESLLHLTAGHPYYLQLTCQNLVNRLNQSATHACVTPEDLQAVLPEVLEAGGGHFAHEWRTLVSPLARCLLSAMAEADDTGLLWFSEDDLAAPIASAVGGKLPVGGDEVRQALDKLVHQDLVLANPQATAWRVRIDLLRHWIRRNQPLARVAEAVAS